MSTAEHPRRTATPPLVAGQRLDQPTFHERYEAMPPGIRAELINGVVSMPSPAGLQHGSAHVPPLFWLMYYEENTPGVQVLDNATTFLGPRSEPQPDAMLRILPECGGQTVADPQYVRGVPELVLEVSHSSRYTDLGPKLEDYERAGVLEYVVRALEPDEVLWHVLHRRPIGGRAAGCRRLVPIPRLPGALARPSEPLDARHATAPRRHRSRCGHPRARGVRRATGRGPRHPLILRIPHRESPETLLDVL